MNSTKFIRSNYSQQTYRKQSKSKNKDKQHVAHTVDLEIVKIIQKGVKGKPNYSKLKKSFNKPSNFRMVSASTNLINHRKIAKDLIESQDQRKKNVKLNKTKSQRVKKQIEIIQKDTSLPIPFKKKAKIFYKKFQDNEGKTLWDSRKDEKLLK